MHHTQAASGEKWQVPLMPMQVDIDAAKEKAYQAAQSFLNHIFAFDDLAVDVHDDNGAPKANVTDVVDGRVVSQYRGEDILKIYAGNYKGTGIIIDGTI